MRSSGCWRLSMKIGSNANHYVHFSRARATTRSAKSLPANSLSRPCAICRKQERRREWKARLMSLFPMFVKLHGRLAVVVGGGEIAACKIEGLLKAGAKVRLIAP